VVRNDQAKIRRRGAEADLPYFPKVERLTGQKSSAPCLQLVSRTHAPDLLLIILHSEDLGRLDSELAQTKISRNRGERYFLAPIAKESFEAPFKELTKGAKVNSVDPLCHLNLDIFPL
jgi:hypothetical protein